MQCRSVDQKKLASALTRDKRLAFLERGSQDVPLSAQAELLTVSRASLYYQPAAPSSEELAWKLDQTLEMPFVLAAVDRALVRSTPTI